jgi:hypothetical protein
MYMLGLGARQPSVNGSLVSTGQRTRHPAPRSETDAETDSLSGAAEDDGDVE